MELLWINNCNIQTNIVAIIMKIFCSSMFYHAAEHILQSAEFKAEAQKYLKIKIKVR